MIGGPTTIPGILNSQQTVDPEVSKVKFERELNPFKELEQFNRERGVFLLRASFPDVVLAFAPVKVRPLILAFAVKINFTNYDLEAPSVLFIDPITEVPLTVNQLLTHLPRKIGEQMVLHPNGQQVQMPNLSNLVQAHPPHQIPFLCLPGVREYHEHPAHSNDPWLTHRGNGEGSLGFVIDQLVKYGTDPITSYAPQNFNINTPGLGVVQFQASGLVLTFEPNNVPS